MNSSTPKPAARQRLIYRLWAVAFILLGGLLLAYNLELFPPGLIPQTVKYWPLLIILLGLLFSTGRIAVSLPPSPFAIDRGEYQSGHLHLAAGIADAQVSAFVGASQLAMGQFPGHGGPRLQHNNGQARLSLDHRAVAPFLSGSWNVVLVKGLPWSFDLHSKIGNFNLNLRDLTVTTLGLRSIVGDVDLTLPAAGQGEMDLRLTLGDLTLRVPEGMAVRIKVADSPLANVQTDRQRFVSSNSREWITPNFSASPHRFTLLVDLMAGDLRVV